MAQYDKEEKSNEQSDTKEKSTDYSALVLQCKQEYDFGLKYRQKREQDWLSVNDLYYGKKKVSLITKANVHVPKMHGTIETFIAKVDTDVKIDFDAIEEGDKVKAAKMNSLIHRDMSIGEWDLKDVVAKKQGAKFGRAIYKKWSTNENGFCDYLEVISCFDFIIDPLAGGLEPMKKARYMGVDNIIKTIDELKDEPDDYDMEEVEAMAMQMKSDRQADNQYGSKAAERMSLRLSDAVFVSSNAVRLVEWYTYWEGEKWYVLFSPDFQRIVRAEPLVEVFDNNEFPFSTWAVFPELDEFWTPGIGELVKEVNIVQNISISQILDNNAFQNYGMTAYDTTKIDDPMQLVPRPAGKVPVNGDPRAAIMKLQFPSLDQAVTVYNLVENIFDKESGVNATAKGMPHSKRMSATEFAGLIEQTADRFFSANKTYQPCLKRIAKLYKDGVEQNMTRTKRIRILGADGFEWSEVTAKDASADLDISISTGAIEEQNKNLQRDRFGEFVARNAQNPLVNKRMLTEKDAQLSGLTQPEIDRLLHPELESDWKILSEASEENEILLDKEAKPNQAATVGHVEKHLFYLKTTNGLSKEQRERILAHAKAEVPIASANEALRANKLITQQIGARNMEISSAAAMEALTPPSAAPGPMPEQMTPPEGMAPPMADSEAVRMAAISGAPQPAAA